MCKRTENMFKITDSAFYGLTIMDLRVLVYEYCTRYCIPHSFNRGEKIARRDYVNTFLKRKTDLPLREPQGVALNRIYGLNKIDLSLFVENLDSVSQQCAFKPLQIYSCDKTGSTCVHKPHVCKVCTIWLHEGCVYNNLCFLCEGYFENDLCVRKSHKNLLKTSKILLDFLT